MSMIARSLRTLILRSRPDHLRFYRLQTQPFMTYSMRATCPSVCHVFHISPLTLTRRTLSLTSVLSREALPFEVDPRVKKDVLLFQYENVRYYKYLTWFGFIQFFFWTYLAQFSYSSLRDVKETELESDGKKSVWWRRVNFGENKYKNGIALLCLTLGYFLFFFTMTLALRSVHRIVLMKGGQKVAVQTFAPFGRIRTIEVSTEHISATKSRQASTSNMALKLKGRMFYFLLDGRGKFFNTDLFDYVVALKRKF